MCVGYVPFQLKQSKALSLQEAQSRSSASTRNLWNIVIKGLNGQADFQDSNPASITFSEDGFHPTDQPLRTLQKFSVPYSFSTTWPFQHDFIFSLPLSSYCPCHASYSGFHFSRMAHASFLQALHASFPPRGTPSLHPVNTVRHLGGNVENWHPASLEKWGKQGLQFVSNSPLDFRLVRLTFSLGKAVHIYHKLVYNSTQYLRATCFFYMT